MGDDGNFMKGLFGIRMVGASNVEINGLVMKDFKALGQGGIVPSMLPGYSELAGPVEPLRFRGNDAWFMSFEVSHDVAIKNVLLTDLTSTSGYGFGIDLANENGNFTIENVAIRNISTPNSIASDVTDLGDAFGFLVENPTGPIVLKNVSTRNLNAAGSATPFPLASDPFITLTNAVAYP